MPKFLVAVSIALALYASPALSQRLFSDKKLAHLGDETYRSIIKELPLITSGESFQVAQCIFAALTTETHAAPAASGWTLTLIDKPDVNAAVLPGGHVLLYRGIMDESIGPDALAFVLATQISTAQRGLPGRQLARGQVSIEDGHVQLEEQDLASEIAASDWQAAQLTSKAGFDPLPGINYLEQTRNRYRTPADIQRLRNLAIHELKTSRQTTCP